MLRDIDKARLKRIHKLLLKVAAGDFSYQIERSEEDDEIEAMLILVNLMSEEMRETLRYYSVLNTSETSNQYINILFVLDSAFKILHTTPETLKILNKNDDIEGLSFSSLLNNCSKNNWKTIAQNILHLPRYHAIHPLTFLCKDKLTKTFTCAITVVPEITQNNPYILITAFETSLKSKLLEDDSKQSLKTHIKKSKDKEKPDILTKEQDIKTIQNIKDHILRNLEHPLPDLRTLANLFGTNEYKLKYGFKQLYDITVFRFLTEERLKRANLLLQNTPLPVKTIAQMTGFKNISHFSKAFKLRYGIKPIDLKKL